MTGWSVQKLSADAQASSDLQGSSKYLHGGLFARYYPSWLQREDFIKNAYGKYHKFRAVAF